MRGAHEAQLQLDAITRSHVHTFYLHIFLCVNISALSRHPNQNMARTASGYEISQNFLSFWGWIRCQTWEWTKIIE